MSQSAVESFDITGQPTVFIDTAIHLKDLERLSKLLTLLTIALGWALKTRQWLTSQTPLVIKKHSRLAKSIFRTGFDYLRRLLLNLEYSADEFSQVLHFLSCT